MPAEPTRLIANRSVPQATIVPVLAYPDVREAVEWLCRVFGFAERLRIGEHRSQLRYGDAGVIVAEYVLKEDRPRGAAAPGYGSHQIRVRVADVQAHHDHAVAEGAQILQELVEHVFGEREYVALDIGGHRWTFAQSMADVAPDAWGGTGIVWNDSNLRPAD
jgi:uncharacterized glyoxalase superfamily protein PhnB